MNLCIAMERLNSLHYRGIIIDATLVTVPSLLHTSMYVYIHTYIENTCAIGKNCALYST